MNKRLQDLGDQILQQLDALPGNDERTTKVRGHVYALLQALGGSPTSATVRPPKRTSVEMEAVQPPSNRVPDINAPGGGSIPVQPHSTRPGLFTERRAARQGAGVTLKQVAEAAHVTLPTARTYEIKRTAVRPDKRKALDQVYDQFARNK